MDEMTDKEAQVRAEVRRMLAVSPRPAHMMTAVASMVAGIATSSAQLNLLLEAALEELRTGD